MALKINHAANCPSCLIFNDDFDMAEFASSLCVACVYLVCCLCACEHASSTGKYCK